MGTAAGTGNWVELARRAGSGLEVLLLWSRSSERVRPIGRTSNLPRRTSATSKVTTSRPRRRYRRRATLLLRAGCSEAELLGSLRGVDGRGAGERSQPSRRTDRVPLPRARRPPRPALAGTRDVRPVPRAARWNAARSRPRTRCRRPRARNRCPPAALPANPARRIDQRPHLRDHLPRGRRRSLGIHVRVGRSAAVALAANRVATHLLHRPCRLLATRSRSQPVRYARKCLL
jgi:hypothetical protein